MRTETTDKALQQAKGTATLVAFPGQEKQRAIRANVKLDRPDLIQRALFLGRQKYDLANLAWFDPEAGTFTPVLSLVKD